MAKKSHWKHVIQYYETDQMQIVHHSNYIRWFEEARSWMLEDVGFGYQEWENTGILIPVLAVSAEYKSVVRYGETVDISARVKQFSGVKSAIEYEVRDAETHDLKAAGETRHAFLDAKTFRPIALKRQHKALYDLFKGLTED